MNFIIQACDNLMTGCFALIPLIRSGGGGGRKSATRLNKWELANPTLAKIIEIYEPGSKLLVLGMGDLPPLIGNPYNGYINPYYWVDDHPLLYGNIGSLDPSTYTLPETNSQQTPLKIGLLPTPIGKACIPTIHF